MHLTLHVWRQPGSDASGRFERYEAKDVDGDLSFLELLDKVNHDLIEAGKEPIAFEHDCREGICGSCGFVVNGDPHGPDERIAACQLHLRSFADGDELWIEPWRARAFPVLKDLMVDRAAFDRIIQAGGYVSARAGSAPDGNTIPIPKRDADRAFDAATCIGCGACVAACPNGSAMLFTSAKIAHLAALPQGQPERWDRVRAMVAQHDREGFGSCTNHGACEPACPKAISIDYIAELNRDLILASLGRASAGGSSASGEGT